MAHLILRLLRVFIQADGRVVFNHRQGAIRPTDDGWWRDVLSDPRARLPVQRDVGERSGDARYRVDRYPLPVVMWRCPCNYACSPIQRDNLINELGPETNLVWALREIVGCRHRNKMGNSCQAMPIL